MNSSSAHIPVHASAIYRTRHSSSITCFAWRIVVFITMHCNGRVLCVHFRSSLSPHFSILFSVQFFLPLLLSPFKRTVLLYLDAVVKTWMENSVTYVDFKQLCRTTIFANQIQRNRAVCTNCHYYLNDGMYSIQKY